MAWVKEAIDTVVLSRRIHIPKCNQNMAEKKTPFVSPWEKEHVIV
jgi:hypothetical protein